MGVKLAVSVALLWLLFSRVDVGKLWNSARHASVAWMTIALGVYAVTIVIMVWRWWLLLGGDHRADGAAKTALLETAHGLQLARVERRGPS